jgi:hypothetical protein
MTLRFTPISNIPKQPVRIFNNLGRCGNLRTPSMFPTQIPQNQPVALDLLIGNAFFPVGNVVFPIGNALFPVGNVVVPVGKRLAAVAGIVVSYTCSRTLTKARRIMPCYNSGAT